MPQGYRRWDTLYHDVVTNGDFAAWTATYPDDWGHVEQGTSTVAEDAGKVVFDMPDNDYVQINQVNLVAGTTYKLLIDITAESGGGTLGIGSDGGGQDVVNLLSGVGTHVFYFVSVDTGLIIKRGSAGSITFDNISVREVLTNNLRYADSRWSGLI